MKTKSFKFDVDDPCYYPPIAPDVKDGLLSEDWIFDKPREGRKAADKLNEIAIAKTHKELERCKEEGVQPAREFRMVAAGFTVYKARLIWPVYLYAAIGATFVLQGCYDTPLSTLPTFVAVGAMMYVWYDFYSAALHIVLDHPKHIDLPGIGFASVEFQWHHHIPTDISEKPFIQACGDLNVVAYLLLAWNVLGGALLGWPLPYSPLGRVILGFKMLAAYLGQYNHRVSHTAKDKVPAFARALQSCGVLLTHEAHREHHRTPHNSNFAIGCGLTNGIFNFCHNRICSHPSAWLVFFLVASVFDCLIIQKIVESVTQLNGQL